MEGDLLAERYALDRPLGAGGMGQVWRARDEVLNREVAVKVMSVLPGDPSAGERFTREARAAARLSHSGVVTVYDTGTDADGRLFMVMELVEGRSLAQTLREDGPLPPERVAEIGAQTARALAAAHAGGVIHRDIKPANLLLDRDGTVKVADFGIAVLADEVSTSLTATNAFIGTATYTAPERAQGQRATPASDLYALGCVLYESLSGQPPFRADNATQVLFQHCYHQPTPLRETCPGVPLPLADVVHALLAKDPVQRPADAHRTAALLSGLPWGGSTGLMSPTAASATAPPMPPGPPRRSAGAAGSGWLRRRRVHRVGLGILALAAFATGIALTWDDSTPQASGPTHTSASRTPTPSVTSSSTSSRSVRPTPEARKTHSLSELATELSDRLNSQTMSMDPKRAKDVRHRTEELGRKISEGKLNEAADKLRDLRKRLAEALKKGDWDGDARTDDLLSRLAARLPARP